MLVFILVILTSSECFLQLNPQKKTDKRAVKFVARGFTEQPSTAPPFLVLYTVMIDVDV